MPASSVMAGTLTFLSSLAQDFIEESSAKSNLTGIGAFLSSLAQDFIEEIPSIISPQAT